MKRIFTLIILFIVIVARLIASSYYFQRMVSNNLLMINSYKLTGFIDQILNYSPAECKLLISSNDWEGKIVVTIRSPAPLMIGQEIIIQNAKLTSWSSLKAGSFKNYLLLKNVWAKAENGQTIILNEFKKNWRYYTYQLHNFFNNYLLDSFSSDVSGFLAGVLVGDTDLLSAEVKNSFRLTGLAHVMAISGANMTMIAQILFRLLFFLSLRKRTIVCALILVLFTIFVGASAAVVRALIMAICVLISLWFNLPYLASRALLGVCLVIYTWNPFILTYDIGFQLSIAATYGLLVGIKPLNSIFYWVPWKTLRDTISITLAATIFTMPISLYYFSSMSLLAPIINILLVPLLASLSIAGYVIVVLSLLPIIGNSVVLMSEYVLRFILSIIDTLSALAEFSHLETNLSWHAVSIWIVLLITMFYLLNRKRFLP